MDFRLLVLALGAFAGTMESAVLPGLLPAISGDYGVSIAQAGLLTFIYSLVYAIAAPLISTLFGRVDRRLTLVIAELVFGIAALAIAVAPAFELAVMARGVLAIAAVLFTSTAQGTAYAISPPDRRGRSVALVLTGATVAVAVGAPLGAMLGIAYGWRWTFGIVAGLGIASGIVLAFYLPAGLAGERHSLSERLAVLRQPGMGMALLISMMSALAVFPPGIYFAVITAGPMHMGAGGIPVLMLSAGVGALIGGAIGGQMTDRLGVFRSVQLFLWLSLIMLLAMWGLTFLPAGIVPPLWTVLYGLLGLVGWGLYTGMVGLLGGLAPKAVTLAISLNLSASNVGGALSALYGGWVVEQLGAGSIGLAAAGFAALTLALLLLNQRTLRRAG